MAIRKLHTDCPTCSCDGEEIEYRLAKNGVSPDGLIQGSMIPIGVMEQRGPFIKPERIDSEDM